MFIQLPTFEQKCLPYDPTIKFYSWVIVIAYVGLISALFFVKFLKTSKEVKSARIMYGNVGLFLLLYIGVRILYLLSDLERNEHCESVLYFQYVFLGYICGSFAFFLLIRFGESYMIKKKNHNASTLIVVCILIDIIFTLFLPNLVNLYAVEKYGSSYSNSEYRVAVKDLATLIRYFNYAILYSAGFVMLSLFVYLTIKSTGQLRTTALRTTIGLLIATIAALLETDALLSSGQIPPFLSPILFSIGITIFAIAYLKSL